jgi:hypothetical protein
MNTGKLPHGLGLILFRLLKNVSQNSSITKVHSIPSIPAIGSNPNQCLRKEALMRYHACKSASKKEKSRQREPAPSLDDASKLVCAITV